MNGLVTIEFVRDRLGLPDDEGVNGALGISILSATPFIEGATDSTVALQGHSDIFFIDTDREMPRAGTFALRLSSGFLKDDPQVLFSVGDSISEVQSIAPSNTPVMTHLEKGVILVPEELGGKFVRVDYSAGFGDYPEVPTWVQEAVLHHVLIAQRMEKVESGKPELNDSFKMLLSQRSFLLDTHCRKHVGSIKPVI